VGGAIPGLVVLGSIRKQAEQAMRSKPQRAATLHGLCISSCLWVLASRFLPLDEVTHVTSHAGDLLDETGRNQLIALGSH